MKFHSIFEGSIFAGLFSRRNNSVYNFGWDLINASAQFRNLTKYKERLAAVLSNPALLKIIALQCDMFSMGKIYVYDKDEQVIENDPFHLMMDKPNPFQNKSQFLWDYMFWLMLGTDYIYADSRIVDPKNKLYHLDPSKIEWPYDMDRDKDRIFLSDAEIKKVMQKIITYRYEQRDYTQFPLEKVIMNTDLTNGTGNWFIGASKIDALYKVISNNEYLLDAENINIRYAGKFLVGSQNDISKIGMGETEKRDLEDKIDDAYKKVWAFKTPVDIKRFVDDFAKLQLKDVYLHQYFIMGNMYNIPRDVLESYNSATYENQEKARAAHINYCLEPKGNQLMDSLARYFGYTDEGKKIFIDWSHLPFMQVFESERANVMQTKINSLTSLLNLGVSLENANKYLDTEFEIDEQEETESPASPEEEGAVE